MTHLVNLRGLGVVGLRGVVEVCVSAGYVRVLLRVRSSRCGVPGKGFGSCRGQKGLPPCAMARMWSTAVATSPHSWHSPPSRLSTCRRKRFHSGVLVWTADLLGCWVHDMWLSFSTVVVCPGVGWFPAAASGLLTVGFGVKSLHIPKPLGTSRPGAAAEAKETSPARCQGPRLCGSLNELLQVCIRPVAVQLLWGRNPEQRSLAQ
jgi:hypothetical protein